MKRFITISLITLLSVHILIGQEVRKAQPLRGTPDQVAQFLAGLPIQGISPLTSMQLSNEYLDHHLAMQASWKECKSEQFDPMKAWATQEMIPRIPSPSIVRYLFGGPDLLSLFRSNIVQRS